MERDEMGSMGLSGDLEKDATRQATMLQKDNVLAHLDVGVGLA